MFRRLILEEWNVAFTLIAFVTALTIFAYIVYWVLRMRKGDVDRIAQLPLEKDTGEVDAKSGQPVADKVDGRAGADGVAPAENRVRGAQREGKGSGAAQHKEGGAPRD